LVPTLSLSVLFFAIVVLLGGALAIQVMRAPTKPPPRALAWLHGIAALISYAMLVDALVVGPPRGVANGTQSFGTDAAVLLLIAAALGLLSLWLHAKRKRMPGAAIGVHASVAIFGYVILAVYLLVG
jgi:hypothetical protein